MKNKKVAVCISGQPRNVLLCFPNIYENLISPNNADVFIHSWIDKNNPEAVYYPEWIDHLFNDKSGQTDAIEGGVEDAILNLYKPKSYWFENPIGYFPTEKSYDSTTHFACFNIHNICSMFNSIFKANYVKQRYEKNHNISYDICIKLRFDFQINYRIDFNKNPMIKNLEDACYTSYYDTGVSEISDQIYFGKNKIVDQLSDLFLYLEDMTKFPHLIAYAEHIIGAYSRFVLNKPIITIDGFGGIVRNKKQIQNYRKYYYQHATVIEKQEYKINYINNFSLSPEDRESRLLRLVGDPNSFNIIDSCLAE